MYLKHTNRSFRIGCRAAVGFCQELRFDCSWRHTRNTIGVCMRVLMCKITIVLVTSDAHKVTCVRESINCRQSEAKMANQKKMKLPNRLNSIHFSSRFKWDWLLCNRIDGFVEFHVKTGSQNYTLFYELKLHDQTTIFVNEIENVKISA